MTEFDTTQLRASLQALLEHHRGVQAAIAARTTAFVAMHDAGLTPKASSEIASEIARQLGATPSEMRTIVGVSPANVTKSVTIAKAARALADADKTTRPVHVVPPPES